MAKEIAIKVKVEGQEVTMAGRQLDNFKKTIENLKKQLESLGARTEQNGEQFDKLKGDIDALNEAFGETTNEVKDTNDSLKQNDEQVQENEKTTKSYTAQIRDLTKQLVALGDRTEENGAQYDSLQSRIKELRDKQEDLQFGTRKLDDALSSLPGPIGQVAGGFKNLDDTFKNAKSALKGLTTQFPILKNAIAATGIGALVIIFGLLVAAVMKAFQTFKPLQDAVGKLSVVFDLLGNTIQPLVDLIGKGLTWAIEGFAKALAWVTGNTDAYIKKQEELKRATKGYTAEAEEEVRALERRAILAQGKEKEMLNLEIEFKKKRIENAKKYNEELTKLREEEGWKEGLKGTEEYYRKLNILDENYAIEDQKLVEEAKKNINSFNINFNEEQLKLQNDYKILTLKKDKEKELEQLKQQKDAQDKSIKELLVSEEEKVRLLGLSGQIYLLKQKEINDKYSKEQKSANEDLRKQIRDIRNGMIEDERERFIKESEARMEDAIKSIQETKASEELKVEAIKAIREQAQKDLEKFDIEYTDKLAQRNSDKAKQDAVTLWNQYQFEKETRQMFINDRLRQIELANMNELELAKTRSGLLQQQAETDFNAEIESIKKLEEAKEITTEEARQRKLALEQNYFTNLKQIEYDYYNEVTAAIAGYRSAIEGLNGTIGTLVSMIGEETKAGKVLVKVQQALTAVTMSLAAAEAFRGLMKDISKGFPTNIIAVASTLATIAAAVAGWVSVFKKSKPEGSPEGSSGGSSSTSTPYYGKNYADGGMIGGRRHAQGGTLIEAEQGEAIMTRGAVSMFRPMLSLMNQMGGGKSFDARIVKPDNPITKQVNQEPIIMKTYVVESELTSEQNKQARLKNLSTI